MFDAALVDQFGTIHDGVAPYPGAVEALAMLRDAGKPVVLLSNTGKRAAPNAARLAELGIQADLYRGFVTSGEAGWRLLAQGRVPGAEGARRCLLLTRDDDGALLDGTGVEAVTRPEDAELVVIAGSDGDRRTLASYRDMLAPFAEKPVPAICLNPDRVMLTKSGPAFGAGRIAETYQELGGRVTWIGKPHPAIYREALAALPGVARDRVAGIGDSVEHDIAGARAAGCRAILVRAGIIAGASDAALEEEFARRSARPDALVESFSC
ncbi:MAG: TIGR01459 family HAD-type hydrolase [Acetobacteraceae bacterium]|nr:TIGR01459 family HAD-type hydrolase [Acetobacteraceae bacterium]